MLYRVIIACSILVSGLDCKSYSHYRKPECGEEIISSSGLQLPSHEVCELKIKNKPGLSIALDIFWDTEKVDREEVCYGLEIFNEATKRYYDICEGATNSFFVTGRGPFVLKMNELPAGVMVHVSYVTPKYTCGQKLNYELFGIPIELHNNGKKDCFMSIPTGSLVRVENPDGNWKAGKCDVQLQVAQGPSIQQATTASHVHCLENEPLDFPVFCQAAILYMTSAIKNFVKVTVMSPTWSEAHRLFNYSRHCAHTQELLFEEHPL